MRIEICLLVVIGFMFAYMCHKNKKINTKK